MSVNATGPVREAVQNNMEIAIPAAAIAEAINYAISQPLNVDVNELIIRPTAQG